MLFGKQNNGFLKKNYRKVLESSTVLSLIVVAMLFYSFKTFKHDNQLPVAELGEFEVLPPPKTQQNKPKPPPKRPQIPIEIDDDDFMGDETIPDTDIDFREINNDIIAPPDEPVEELEFFAVSEKPILIKQVQPIYPQLAIHAGIEGTVVIKALVDTKGNIEKVVLLKSIPMLDESAINAAKQCKYTPGKQRDRYVKVWVSLPFKFSLRTRSM